jgi:uncharacterized cupredoxin-like copper-binding protein
MKKILFVALLAASVLVGCGGGAASTSLDVNMVEFAYVPNSFTVPAGEEITLHIVNGGAVVHDFVIMNAGASVGEKYDNEDKANIYWMIELPSGGDETVTFTAPSEPGEYQVVCGIPGHYSAGMFGTLTVVAGE